MEDDHCERASVGLFFLFFFYLCQVVQRIQDVPLDLELVLHQFSRQPALCLAAHIHHFAVRADTYVSLTVLSQMTLPLLNTPKSCWGCPDRAEGPIERR